MRDFGSPPSRQELVPSRIVIPKDVKRSILLRCAHLFSQPKLPGRNPKAFGVLTTPIQPSPSNDCTICYAYHMEVDLRQKEPWKSMMDDVFQQFHTVLCPYCSPEDRGWIADPREYSAIVQDAKDRGEKVVGTYHMHSCPIPILEKPTQIDLVLNHISGFRTMLIADLRNIYTPALRAYAIERDPRAEDHNNRDQYSPPEQWIKEIPMNFMA